MTLEELYAEIGGNYQQAIRTMRLDRLIDKHIVKLAQSDLFAKLDESSAELDPDTVFGAVHNIKGTCGNLALMGFYDKASVLSDEFRKGRPRTMSDDEARQKIAELMDDFEGIKATILAYAAQK